MKAKLILVYLFASGATVSAQQKSFEGTATYKVDVKSKTDEISDRVWKKMLALGDSVTMFIKNGNYRQVTELSDIYFIANRQRSYLRFRGSDTLYYMDYDSDTTTVNDIIKTGDERTIAGYSCKPFSVITPATTWKYYYAKDLYLDPSPDLNNKINRYDVFAKETSSLYLALYQEGQLYLSTETCTRLQRQAISDSVFNLPALPQKKYSYDAILKPAEYPGAGGWLRYLQTHLDADLGIKYVRIPRGQKTAREVVRVRFEIDENGRISKVHVLNSDEVHAKLAEEAVRVI